MALVVMALVSGVSFLYYGYTVLSQPRMKVEFDRYRMPGVRRLVGAVELLGGAGVLLGLAYPPLGALAAAGLTSLMVLGLLTRLRIHDEPRTMVPAALLAALNAVLVVWFLDA
jgi:uncharacterized membrane protein YphA (DoxX/SURF4 family)